MTSPTEQGRATRGARYRRMLKSKIHRITVTESNLGYLGSLTLDGELMDAADLLEYEQIEIANLNTGGRFSTYLLRGAPRECCLNGAAARLGEPGDLLILMAFELVDEELLADWKPRVINVDGTNRALGG